MSKNNDTARDGSTPDRAIIVEDIGAAVKAYNALSGHDPERVAALLEAVDRYNASMGRPNTVEFAASWRDLFAAIEALAPRGAES